MTRKLICFSFAIAIVALSLTGCCGGGGEKKTTETIVVTPPTENPTAGKQLQDLKDARDQGAITDQEYEKAKEKILKAQ